MVAKQISFHVQYTYMEHLNLFSFKHSMRKELAHFPAYINIYDINLKVSRFLNDCEENWTFPLQNLQFQIPLKHWHLIDRCGL